MAHLIEVSDLTKTYKLGEVEVHALRGVSLTIERGELVAVMGASGSGKTTLMNILGCLDRPSSGRFLLDGIDVTSLSEERLAGIRSHQIGFVFQSYNLLPRTTALENVELPLFYSAFTEEGKQRAADLLKMVGLADRLRNHPNQLSGGQQQRVAIARALINQPAILFADEPTGNLDSQSSTEIMEIIRRLNREQGLTVILVTHEPDIARYADRVISFRDGVVISDQKKGAAPHACGAHRDRAAALWAQERLGGLSFGTMALTAAARSVRRNKMRAALTMLGIFIGVAAVIATVAVGDGAAASVQQQIQSLGTNLLIVLPGATTTNGVRAGFGSASTLTVADAEAIEKEDGAIAMVGYFDRQVAQVEYGHQNWSTSINGTTANYLAVRDWPVASGREFSEAEERSGAPVCLLGQTVAANLFGPDENPLGATIRIKNSPLTVIGVLSTKGQSTYGQDQDDVVLIPFNTAERKVLGVAAPASASGAGTPTPSVTNPYASVPTTNSIYSQNTATINPFGGPLKITGVVHMIMAKARSADEVEAAQSEIIRTLHRQHRIQPGKDDDFSVRNLNEVAQTSEGASRVMTLLLGAVASISLLVGGIGIMNIMLVSVTERTREIGIRMAIGARRLHILLQFLVEAIFLSALGGLAGVILGVSVSRIISIVAQWPTLVSPKAVVGGFLFSAAVGIFFGYYPARKASLLDPIEALRYE